MAPATFVLLSLFTVAALAAVNVLPWEEPEEEWFDPKSPPPGLGRDGADCTGKVEWTGGTPEGTWTKGDSTYTVSDLTDITVRGYSVIRLPDDADTVLVNHEYGHDRLNAFEYGQRARKKFEAASRVMKGMKFKGVGATDSIRFLDATDKAQAFRDSLLEATVASVLKQMKSLSDMFDDLTKHGTSGTCTTNQGEALTKAKYAEAPPAGKPKKTKDESKQKSSGGTTNKVYYSAPERSLIYVGPGEIMQTTNPADPVRTEGRVLVDAFIEIGPLEDGSILLSDSRLRIEHIATGDTLLNGYLLEASYVPPDGSNPEGAVQAYLAILPAWAGGVKNTIGSEFLAEMQLAAETDGLTMLWLESPVPLFDTTGVSLIPPEGIVAPFTIGFALPPVIGVGDRTPRPPAGLSVSPQPGSGSVRFAWAPRRGGARLELYDLSGARRRTVALDASRGAWLWDGTDDSGRKLAAGVYFARLEGPGLSLRTRVVRLQ